MRVLCDKKFIASHVQNSRSPIIANCNNYNGAINLRHKIFTATAFHRRLMATKSTMFNFQSQHCRAFAIDNWPLLDIGSLACYWLQWNPNPLFVFPFLLSADSGSALCYTLLVVMWPLSLTDKVDRLSVMTIHSRDRPAIHEHKLTLIEPTSYLQN